MVFLDRLQPYRIHLVFVALFGLIGLNGVFLYCALFEPRVLAAAWSNLVSVVFLVEAFVMVGLGAVLIRIHRIVRPGWLAFVVMSFVGGLAFSVPMFLVLHLRAEVRAAESQRPVR